MRGLQIGWPFLITVLSTLLSTSAAADTMAPGDSVGDRGSLVSAGGSFRLGFFTPGGSKFRYLGIWYNNVSVQTVVWVANRDRRLNDSTGVLSMNGNGSLVLSDGRREVYWSTVAARGLPNPVARLLDNGNFVVTGSGRGASTKSYAWQCFDYPTDSLLPGMRLGWDLRSGRNRNITAWKSADDPGTGEYAMGMDVRGDPQIFLVQGTRRLWRTGPWIGQRFSGIPEMMTYDTPFSCGFHSGAGEVYYQFDAPNSSLISRLVVQPTGVVERVVWVEGFGTWNRIWFAPRDQCDAVSHCGPFGVCDANDSPVCNCVPGFGPRSPQDWYLRDGRDGCVRRTAVDCRNGTDGFVQVAGAKLPDTSAAVVNYTMGLEDCREACLRNCSCTAYANAEVTGGGSGCILWGGDLTDLRLFINGGQDLFVRVAAADLVKESNPPRKRVASVTLVALVLGTLLFGWICYCTWTRMRMRKKRRAMAAVFATTTSMSSHTNDGSSRANDLELPLFDFSTIAAATDDFSAEHKLGEGGFGPVYMVNARLHFPTS